MDHEKQAKTANMTGKLDCEPKTLTVELFHEAITALKQAGAAPRTAYHPDYGQILRDGQLTEAGKKFEWDTAIRMGYDPKQLGLDEPVSHELDC